MNFLSEPIKDGTTGTVIVLTTPDAQRTMLAYQVRLFGLLTYQSLKVLHKFKGYNDLVSSLGSVEL